ncbi:MAG: hypothetical protein V1859_11755 [archaeon]
MIIKWNNKYRPLLIIGFIIVLVLLLITLFYPYNQSEKDTSFWIKISGNISSQYDKSLSARPSYVRIYYFPNNLNNLCSAKSAIDHPAYISWNNKTGVGEYTISFKVPIDMQVTITTDCNSCNHNLIELNSENREYHVDLEYGDLDCADDIEDYVNASKAFNRAITLLSHLNQEILRQKVTNTSEILQASDDLSEGFENVEDLGYSTNETEILRKSYLAIYFGWRAAFLLDKHELKMCVDDFHAFQEKTSYCYDTPIERLKVVHDVNNTYSTYPITNNHHIYEDNIEKIKNLIIRERNNRDAQRDAYWDCARALSDSEQEFGLIKSKCEVKETKNNFTNILTSILIVLSGIIVYIWRNVIKEWEIIKYVLDIIKKLTQPQKNINQKSGDKNSIVNQIAEVNATYFNQNITGGAGDINQFVAKDKTEALKAINDKMIDCLNKLNKYTETGIKNKNQLKEINDLIEEYKLMKMKNKIYFDNSLNLKLTEVFDEFKIIYKQVTSKSKKISDKNTDQINVVKLIKNLENAQKIIRNRLKL